ncbi:MAG: hypothetical protein J5635_04510 [Paludibacteraceae bacterium]|nr:hypothetical protein [Paludibacteraceae bacterium]
MSVACRIVFELGLQDLITVYFCVSFCAFQALGGHTVFRRFATEKVTKVADLHVFLSVLSDFFALFWQKTCICQKKAVPLRAKSVDKWTRYAIFV